MCLSEGGGQLSRPLTGENIRPTGGHLSPGSVITVPVNLKKGYRPALRNARRPKAVRERTYKRPDGMILFDNSLCIGCYKCIDACPYGVRYVDPAVKLKRPDREKDAGIGKCTFCDHRVDNGIEPSCVQACPHKARTFGDMNDSGSKVSKLIKEFNLDKNRNKTTMLDQEKTMPHVFYIDPDGVLSHYSFDYKDKENRLAEYRDRII
jgi:tetrathionate reductase subunit B